MYTLHTEIPSILLVFFKDRKSALILLIDNLLTMLLAGIENMLKKMFSISEGIWQILCTIMACYECACSYISFR